MADEAAAAFEAIRRELRRVKVQVIDVRPPHTETGLATRPLAGAAPKMPEGLSPRAVAERIVDAIEHRFRQPPIGRDLTAKNVDQLRWIAE